jgi:hypothetical protein
LIFSQKSEINSVHKSGDHLSQNYDVFQFYNICKLARLPMEEGISPVNWFPAKSLDVQKSENK